MVNLYFSQGTQEEWRVVFFASSALMLVAALSFIILAEDGIADWAKDSQKRNKLEAEAEMKRLEKIQKDAKTEGIFTIKPETDDIINVRF